MHSTDCTPIACYSASCLCPQLYNSNKNLPGGRETSFCLAGRSAPLPYRLENKKELLLFNTEFRVHKIIPTMCLRAYKLNGSRSRNTNNTIRTGTHSFVVSVRHGLSTETITQKE